MKTYRAAVVGCGKGGKIHLQAYRESPHFELAAVCDISPAALEAQQKEQPGLKTYADFREMLDKEELDFLSVATLPPTHEAVVEAGIAAGVKAILCEKPIAHDPFAGRRIIAMCEESGTPLAVTHQFRTLPHALAIKSLCDTGAIGEPYLCEMRIKGWDLINAGVHMINAVSFLLGDPAVVEVLGQMDCATRVVRDGMQVETLGLTHFVFDNSVRGVLETGDDVAFPPNRPNDMTIYGTTGRIDFGLWQREFILWSPEHPEGMKQTPEPEAGAILGHRAFAEALIQQVETGERDYTLARTGLAALEVVFASYLSSCHGMRVAVPVAEHLKLNPGRAWAGLPARGELPA